MSNNEKLQKIILTIRQRRIPLAYSQDYIAGKMNIGQNCYSKIELGQSKLTVVRFLLICKLLELDINCLFEPEVALSRVS